MKWKNLFIQILLFNLIGEIAFSFLAFHSLSIYLIFYTILNSSFFYLLFNLIKKKKIINIFYVLKTFLLLIEYLYFKIYKAPLTIGVFFKSLKVIFFANNIIKLFSNNFILILFLFSVMTFFIILNKNVEFKKLKWHDIIAFFVMYILIFFSLMIHKAETYSAYNLYFNKNYPLKNLQTFGVGMTFRLDLQRSIFGFKEKSLVIKNKKGKYDVDKYNILDIDFKNSNNTEINEINAFLQNQEPTFKNEMTGLLKEKNLIFILAESFSTIAIHKDLTPNLYKLKTEGYTFKNYYNPLYPVSTADGQYIYDNSLFPSDATNALIKTNKNYHPYSLANIFKYLNYNTYSYHDYLYDYYERDKYYLSMGFNVYKAVGNGLDVTLENGYSDYEMAKVTIGEYLNDEKFLAYYLTMSGHPWYSQDNKVAKRNIAKLQSYNFSNEVKIYMATQIELDKMIGELFNELIKADKLDDTVIVLVPDHVPYGLSLKQMNELSNFARDADFEKYRSEFIIYNKDINMKEKCSLYLSNIDVLPTLLNLFGIEYDSRLLIGKDIFGIDDNIIVFGDRSMVSSKFKYNNMNDYMEGNINASTVKDLKEIVYQKYRISRLILENDYYNYLFEFN